MFSVVLAYLIILRETRHWPLYQSLIETKSRTTVTIMPNKAKEAVNPKLKHKPHKGCQPGGQVIVHRSQSVASLFKKSELEDTEYPRKSQPLGSRLITTTAVSCGWNQGKVNIKERERNVKRTACHFLRLVYRSTD